jgi:hypothetical protein
MTGPAKRSGWQEGERGTAHYFRPDEFRSACGQAFRLEGSRVYRSPMTAACLTCNRLQKLAPPVKRPIQLFMFQGIDPATGRPL